MASHGRHGISAIVLSSETVKVLTISRNPGRWSTAELWHPSRAVEAEITATANTISRLPWTILMLLVAAFYTTLRARTHNPVCRRGSLNIRFAPKATELQRHRQLSRRAITGLMHGSKIKRLSSSCGKVRRTIIFMLDVTTWSEQAQFR